MFTKTGIARPFAGAAEQAARERYAKEFEEGKHPRDEAGTFAQTAAQHAAEKADMAASAFRQSHGNEYGDSNSSLAFRHGSEAINASRKAREASSNAGKNPDAGSHIEAQSRHAHAGEMHQMASRRNAEMKFANAAAAHDEAADAHFAAAEAHGEAAAAHKPTQQAEEKKPEGENKGKPKFEMPESLPGIKFPHKVKVEVEWPATTKHDGKTYRQTGKVGTNRKTGLPAAEYRDYGAEDVDRRVWLLGDGSVEEE